MPKTAIRTPDPDFPEFRMPNLPGPVVNLTTGTDDEPIWNAVFAARRKRLAKAGFADVPAPDPDPEQPASDAPAQDDDAPAPAEPDTEAA